MKKIITSALLLLALFFIAHGEQELKLGEVLLGNLSGHAQVLSMHRNYEGKGNGASTTLGGVLNFESVSKYNLSLGLSYVHVEVLGHSGGRYGSRQGENLLYNGKVNLFNETYLNYVCPKSSSSLKIGRQVVNGEIFRANPFRQKKRSLEAAVINLRNFELFNFTLGHAQRISNVWDHRDHPWLTWKFKDVSFGSLGKRGVNFNYDTNGFHWLEGVFNNNQHEFAFYYGRSSEIADTRGLRSQLNLGKDFSLLGYFRSEESIDNLEIDAPYDAMMYGISLAKKYGLYSLETGFLGVSGDGLLFEELNTGIKHSLGSSLMIYPGTFNGGAKNAYLKLVIKKPNQRLYYFLYNHTWHSKTKSTIDTAQEIDFVFKHPWNTQFSFNLKGGYGLRKMMSGQSTDAIDLRFFLKHTF
jgi:hypothetical protein